MLFDNIKKVIKQAQTYFILRDLAKIEKMEIKDKRDEEIAKLKIRKYELNAHIDNAKANIIRLKGGV